MKEWDEGSMQWEDLQGEWNGLHGPILRQG